MPLYLRYTVQPYGFSTSIGVPRTEPRHHRLRLGRQRLVVREAGDEADGVEEEADAITSQVLAELGVEMDSKMVGLSAPSAKPQGEEALLTEEEQDALGDALPDLKARLDAL